MTDLDRDPTPIFETARRQAQALLAARLDAPPRALPLPTRGGSSHAWGLGLALGAASLLVVSGAWAWVHHAHANVPALVKPAPPLPLARVTAVVTAPAPIVAVRMATPHARKRAKPTPPQAPPDQVRFDEEPMGDVIFGRGPRTPPPLFTVEEYKARGVLVH
jgi:hypothetical protein